MELSSTSPHSPDLAPSDFTFFRTLKEASHKKGFGSDNKIVEKNEEMKKWYKKGIVALVSRWRKAVEVDGDM